MQRPRGDVAVRCGPGYGLGRRPGEALPLGGGRHAAGCDLVQPHVAVPADGDLSDAGRPQQRGHDRRHPAGAHDDDAGGSASGQHVVGLLAVADAQCREVGGESRHLGGAQPPLRADEQPGCVQGLHGRTRQAERPVRDGHRQPAHGGPVDAVDDDPTGAEFDLDLPRAPPQQPRRRVERHRGFRLDLWIRVVDHGGLMTAPAD